MARMPRLYVAGCAQHIIQRGNNRSVCFYYVADYAFYLQKLREASERYSVGVHAFVLMTNHVHLLVTPSDAEGVPRMMQSLGRMLREICQYHLPEDRYSVGGVIQVVPGFVG